MIRLFFDIETLPCDEENKEKFLEVLRGKNSNAEKTDDELYTHMSFDGAFGRICCIGYIKENDNGIMSEGVLCGDEKKLLEEFWEVAQGVGQFIGHNIYEFDLPFIYKRSLIKSVRPRFDISFARYRNTPIYDTMREWDLWGDPRKAVSLDLLAKVFNLHTSKDEMDGSMVWPYYQDGRTDEIYKYCMKDVVLSREVYYKMTCRELRENPKWELPKLQSKVEAKLPIDIATFSADSAMSEEIPF